MDRISIPAIGPADPGMVITVADRSPLTAIFMLMSPVLLLVGGVIFIVMVPSNCAANGVAATRPISVKAMKRRMDHLGVSAVRTSGRRLKVWPGVAVRNGHALG